MGLLTVLVELHSELQSVLVCLIGEARCDHSGVGVEDAVEGQTCSLDWVLVHFSFFIYYNSDINH